MRSIVRPYFGIELGERLNMRQIGALHGLSESRVSQVMADILQRAAERPELRELVRGGEFTRGAS